MTQEHQITPPPELIEDWIEITKPLPGRPPNPNEFAALAARWGADQELNGCCEWLINEGHEYEHVALRDARRPKPPSLKEQALEALDRMDQLPTAEDQSIIRRALESLPE